MGFLLFDISNICDYKKMSDISDIMSNSLAHLARNLKYYRARLGFTQVELAQKAGVNRSYLASIESETQPNTSIKTVEKLAAALGVDLLDLLQAPEDRWLCFYW